VQRDRAKVVDRIRGMRKPSESCRDLILRLVCRRGGLVGARLPPKMTIAQIAEAQRMAREWKGLGSRSECALDERAAPRTGRVFCPAY
jgi:hypothetical protein